MNSILSYLFNLYFRFPFLRRFFWAAVSMGIVIATFVTVFYSRNVITSPVGWDKRFTISPLQVFSKDVKVAARGNFIGAVFEGKVGDGKGIYSTVSFNGGKSFLRAVKVGDVYSNIECIPHVAISGNGHVAVVWQNLLKRDSITRLFFSISKDMGATWSSPGRIFTSPEVKSEMQMVPQVFYDNRGVLHLFYHSFKKDIVTLFHSISRDEMVFEGGEALVELYGGLRIALLPSIHITGRNIFIVWQGKGERLGVLSDDLFIISSDNYGRSWGSRNKITQSAANDASPSIVLHKDVLYLAYQNYEDDNWSIMLQKGYDGGTKWIEKPIKISATNANCYSPTIVVSDNNEVIIFWYDIRYAKPAVHARRYSITELRSLSEVRLSKAKVAARKPVSVSIGNAAIVFWEESGRILAKYSDVYAEPPRVFSITHPQDQWRRSSTAQVEWSIPKDESGIIGFAAIDNNIPDFNPTIKNYETNITKIKIPDLDDGVTYFHIRSIDGANNFSRTIHYKIQVSNNPPAPPVVISNTHPEGKAVKNRSPRFIWSVDAPGRLKGFEYSLSKDPLKIPDRFTNNINTEYENLEDGRYFFKIKAIDKANARSRITAYEIIVNKAGPIDPSTYALLTKDYDEKFYRQNEEIVLVKIPSVRINFPFDISKQYNGSEFNAIISTKNINPRNLIGYSVFIDAKEGKLLNRVNLKKDIVRVKGLKDGGYYIGVKGKYFKIENNKKRFYWTKPFIAKFTVMIPPKYSPIVTFANSVLKRLASNWMIISLSVVSALSLILTVGFGAKLTFYTRLFQFRLKGTFRTIFFT